MSASISHKSSYLYNNVALDHYTLVWKLKEYSWYLKGLVTSVNDIVTEIQYQFMAEDVKEFAGFDYVKMVNDFAFEEAKISNTPQDELIRELGIDPNSTSLKHYEEKLGSPASVIIDTELAMRLSETLNSSVSYDDIVKARQGL